MLTAKEVLAKLYSMGFRTIAPNPTAIESTGLVQNNAVGNAKHD